MNPSWQAAYKLFDVNVLGTFNTVFPLLSRMQQRGRGQIAFMGSLSSYAPVPDLTAYAATKAAIRAYALGMTLCLPSTPQLVFLIVGMLLLRAAA